MGTVVPSWNCRATTAAAGAAGAGGSATCGAGAAITVSADPFFAKYWADVQTNGNRVEMITTTNVKDHFGPMAKNWMQRLGSGRAPQRVLFIRDGVSELVSSLPAISIGY